MRGLRRRDEADRISRFVNCFVRQPIVITPTGFRRAAGRLLQKGQLFITDTRTRYKATTAPRTIIFGISINTSSKL
jgi:hypothetical protein